MCPRMKSKGRVEIAMADPQMNHTQGPGEDAPWLFEELENRFEQCDSMHFRDLVEVSDSLMAGYAKFVRQGLPGEMVGVAMLGATINFYDIFEMRGKLPQLLRSLADRIEQSPQ